MAAGRIAAIAILLAVAGTAQAEPLPEIRPPDWGGLTPRQKQVLTPLQSEWDSLPDARRKNWLGIANRYPRMSVEEQRRVQARIREWAELTPDQRRKARERYRSLQNVPPKQREALKHKWEEKANLPDKDPKVSPGNGTPPPDSPPRGGGRDGANPRATETAPADNISPTQPAASKSIAPASTPPADHTVEEKTPTKSR